MQLEILQAMVIIIGISAAVVYILGRFNVPSIVGFLVAGVIIGPSGFQIIKDINEVETLAELGVVLLMFTIGLELSLKKLISLRTLVFGAGTLQILLTIGATTMLSSLFLGQKLNDAVFHGFLISLSSTAIVMKLLFDKAELNTPYGGASLTILIFQDLCIVLLMLLVPVLAGNSGGIKGISFVLLKAFFVVGVTLVGARWIIPRILHEIVHTKIRELFIITIIFLCIGTALLTSLMGLSLGLGAFLAGVIISESEYSSQAISDILPFKESFIGLFFISVGMLTDLSYIKVNLIVVIVMVIIVLLIKIITTAASLFAFRQSLGISIRTGFYLSQIGEFSFILAIAGKTNGLINEDLYQAFLSASVITMILTPLMMNISSPVSEWIASGRIAKIIDKFHTRAAGRERYPARTEDHVIVVGFGLNGENLGKVLKESGIPYVVLETNARTVRTMKKRGEPIYYGDGTSIGLLHKLGIKTAKVLVIAISDPSATRRIVQIARHENLDLCIIVRTRYISEVNDLIKLGADEVIPEEFETSVEIFSKVLHYYNVPTNLIMDHIDIIRRDSYKALRSVKVTKRFLDENQIFLTHIETATYYIKKDSMIKDRTIRELNLRQKTGATLIAVQRGESIVQNPGPSFILKTDDMLLLIGKREDIGKAIKYLNS
jgi:CPA2 family monovalent cation:H+ antiporter-2